MAPSIQTGNTKGSSVSNETTTTVTKPGTSPSGDLIFIAIVSDAASNTFTFDGSFTELYIDESYQSVSTAGVAYKTSGGAESNYSVTIGTSERQAWQCFSVTGHNGINVSPASSSGSSGTATFPAMTTTVDDCLGIRICTTDQNATSTIPFGAMSGSGWTQLDEVFGTSAGAVGVWYKTITTATTEASTTATLNVSEQWWTASFAIAPAATGTTISKSDTVTLSESVAATLVSLINKSDTVTLSESVTARLESYINKSETVTVSESVAATLVNNVNVSDTVTLSESVGLSIISPTDTSKSETVTVSESVAARLESFINASDTVTLSESVTARLESFVNNSETITVSESVAATLAHNANVSDTVTLTEAVSVTVSTATINVSDTVTITESVTVSRGGPSATDTVTITETVSVSVATPRINVSETITVSESKTITFPGAASTPVLIKSYSAPGRVSIAAYEPLATGNGYVDDLTGKVNSYEHEIAAMGGYWSAKIQMVDKQIALENWYESGLGRRIVTTSPDGEVIWEGFVNEISLSLGGLSIKLGPLTGIANKVKLVYSTFDTSASAPVTGIRAETAYSQDTPSQAKYGILTHVLSSGGATSTTAAAIVSEYLRIYKDPEVDQERTFSGGGSAPSMTLDCLGYVHFLDTYKYNQTASSGTMNLSAKINAVIAAEPNNFINHATGNIASNTVAVPQYENDDKTAWSIIKELASLGDASDNKYIFGVYENRTCYYNAIPTSADYFQHLADPGQRILTDTGQIVMPWQVLPGRWIMARDLLIGRVADSVLIEDDPRVMFVESVNYTIPNKVNLRGSKVRRLDQKLAKLGLAGIGG